MTNPTDWGGKRKGAGRPAGRPRRHLRIAATDEEYREILAWLTPRQRAEALLDAAAVERIAKGEDDGGSTES